MFIGAIGVQAPLLGSTITAEFIGIGILPSVGGQLYPPVTMSRPSAMQTDASMYLMIGKSAEPESVERAIGGRFMSLLVAENAVGTLAAIATVAAPRMICRLEIGEPGNGGLASSSCLIDIRGGLLAALYHYPLIEDRWMSSVGSYCGRYFTVISSCWSVTAVARSEERQMQIPV
jgi:hypothetical protein